MKRLTMRAQAGVSLAGIGVLLVVLSITMLFLGMRPAFALADPTNEDKSLICHSLDGPPDASDGLSVNNSALQTAHLDAGHTFDIIEGVFSVSLGRIAVAADIATIIATPTTLPNGKDGVVYTIIWLCGDSTGSTTTTSSTTTTTTSTSTTTTSTTTTTTTSTTTTTTTIPETTTTTEPPTTTTTSTTTTTTTVPETTTTTFGGPTTTTTTVGTTTTTVGATTTTTNGGTTSSTKPDGTTTTIGGPCDPNSDPDCLPNTGAGALMWVMLSGLGLLFFGTGVLMVADERRKAMFA